MLDGDFVLADVDSLGNPTGWEEMNLLNAIWNLVRRHQCAPISCLVWKDLHESYITDRLELIQV
jgi:hypothetical protein